MRPGRLSAGASACKRRDSGGPQLESVAPCERIGVIGERGIHKSAMLRLAAGPDRSDAGRMRYPRPHGAGYLPRQGQAVA
ncbi:hypothetical protein [Streptomyces sp. b94]|uniref:hypothetical protein n=1 Tax=Streptomyces sp. b94 TaxID=1827634 RepID=UPI001B365B8A|nr:hypothetical protein [Streptomyces sp. b94]